MLQLPSKLLLYLLLSATGLLAVCGGKLDRVAGKELAADYFCQRREIGVLNIGQSGTVTVDGTDYPMANREMLYIGRGSEDIRFSSSDPKSPARFYLLSYPAHTAYPTTHATPDDANTLHLGSPEQANEQCAISPMWSIHSGCGTGSYTFCWGMGGENQRFEDMDHIAIKDLW